MLDCELCSVKDKHSLFDFAPLVERASCWLVEPCTVTSQDFTPVGTDAQYGVY